MDSIIILRFFKKHSFLCWEWKKDKLGCESNAWSKTHQETAQCVLAMYYSITTIFIYLWWSWEKHTVIWYVYLSDIFTRQILCFLFDSHGYKPPAELNKTYDHAVYIINQCAWYCGQFCPCSASVTGALKINHPCWVCVHIRRTHRGHCSLWS